MERTSAKNFESDLNLEATELRLGLPGRDESDKSNSNNKRSSSQMDQSAAPPPQKTQVVGWPPVRSHRRIVATKKAESDGMFVKVSMDGAPYLRKIDINCYSNYFDFLKSLENMFNCTIGVYSEREGYNGSEFAPIYEDKDGDWMLVGDVPWEMFSCGCKRLRIIKASDAKGIGCQ